MNIAMILTIPGVQSQQVLRAASETRMISFAQTINAATPSHSLKPLAAPIRNFADLNHAEE